MPCTYKAEVTPILQIVACRTKVVQLLFCLHCLHGTNCQRKGKAGTNALYLTNIWCQHALAKVCFDETTDESIAVLCHVLNPCTLMFISCCKSSHIPSHHCELRHDWHMTVNNCFASFFSNFAMLVDEEFALYLFNTSELWLTPHVNDVTFFNWWLNGAGKQQLTQQKLLLQLDDPTVVTIIKQSGKHWVNCNMVFCLFEAVVGPLNALVSNTKSWNWNWHCTLCLQQLDKIMHPFLVWDVLNVTMSVVWSLCHCIQRDPKKLIMEIEILMKACSPSLLWTWVMWSWSKPQCLPQVILHSTVATCNTQDDEELASDKNKTQHQWPGCMFDWWSRHQLIAS